MMDWIKDINLTASYMIILGSLLLSFPFLALFYLKHAKMFDSEYQSLSEGEFNWLIWPAIGANYLFDRLFGKKGENLRGLFKIRSVSAIFLISLFANSICILLILLSIPTDVPPFDLGLIKILGLSYFVFIIFNFLGDLTSINVTRHVLAKIVSRECNFIRYLLIDFLGILFGYFITLLPSIIIFAYCWNTNAELNPWIHRGLLGNALIPFFLFIFATTNMPLVFALFAAVAVFSLTIPTLFYLLLMCCCYLGYRTYLIIWRNQDLSVVESILKLVLSLGKILLLLAPFLLAIAAILKTLS